MATPAHHRRDRSGGGALVEHLGDATPTWCRRRVGHGRRRVAGARPFAGPRGDVLILYGDTPLIRDSSVRGLLRHRLKAAAMTLLCALGDPALPYGRVQRDADGHIVDVVEAGDAPRPTAHSAN
ncbi:MAG: hypothetical protein R2854_07620 [Caldilineaceae bacterium]